MKIGEIASSVEYRMDEQFQNLPGFRTKFWFYKLKKFYKFINFPMRNFQNWQKIKFLLLLNFKN